MYDGGGSSGTWPNTFASLMCGKAPHCHAMVLCYTYMHDDNLVGQLTTGQLHLLVSGWANIWIMIAPGHLQGIQITNCSTDSLIFKLSRCINFLVALTHFFSSKGAISEQTASC